MVEYATIASRNSKLIHEMKQNHAEEQTDLSPIHERIRYYRKLRGLTMQALAKEIGTSQQQIDRLEKGKRRLTIEWLQRIGEALECELVDLMPASEQRETGTSTCRTKIIGSLSHTKRIEWLDQSACYQVVFGKPHYMLSKRMFGIRVDSKNKFKLPVGSELIFAELDLMIQTIPDKLNSKHIVICTKPKQDHITQDYEIHKYTSDIDERTIRAIMIKQIRNEF